MFNLKQSLINRNAKISLLNPIAGLMRFQMLTQYTMRYKLFWEKRRKAKCFKWKVYPWVPTFMKTVRPDPFDYSLQTKEEVRNQLIEEPLFEMKVGKTTNNYSGIPLDYPQDGKMLAEAQATAEFNIHKLPMSTLQKERLIFLLGRRYKPKTGVFSVKWKQYATYEQNYRRLMEIIRELFLEALRAPRIDIASIRSPYRYDRVKRALGRTKEEREKKLAEREKHKEDAHKLHKEEGKLLRYEEFLNTIKEGLENEAKNPQLTKEQERERFEKFIKQARF